MMEGMDAPAWLAQMKNSNSGMSQLLGGKPGASEAMTQMGKEMEKLKGTRVLETLSMAGVVPAGSAPNANTGNAQNGQTNSGGNSGAVAGQVATDTATQTAANQSSKLGGFGSALGSSVMGAWHRKKANANTNTNSNATNTDTTSSANTNGNSNSSAAPAGGNGAADGTSGNGQGTQNVVLMSMTTQKSSFSQETVPAAVFEIPAGFTQVVSPMANMH
jgi:hypothetical protein